MPSARRLLTIGGATFVGLAATALFAAPASAHSASGEAVACKTTTGSWLVSWKVSNDFNNPVTLTKLTAKPGAINGIGNNAKIGAKGTITGTQEVDKDGIKDAKLSYVAQWKDGYTAGKQTITPEKKGDCTPDQEPPGCKPGKPGDVGDKGKPCEPCTPGTGGDKTGKPGVGHGKPCEPCTPGPGGDKPGKPGDGHGNPCEPCTPGTGGDKPGEPGKGGNKPGKP